MTEETTKLGVSRRTLAKGAAWTVPAAAVVAVAPGVAASPVCELVPVLDINNSCKRGNLDRYKLRFRVGYRQDAGCPPVPTDCTATIYKVGANNDITRVIWQNSAGTTGDIVICDAPNMANFLAVEAVLSCGPNAGQKVVYERIRMSSVPSINNCDTEGVCDPGGLNSSQEAVADQQQPRAEEKAVEETKAPQAKVEETKAEAPQAKVEETKVEAPAAAEEAATTEVASEGDDA